jgi:PIN domain nuclease of toxin-antitoxin system
MAKIAHLDTHAAIWLYAGETKLFPEAALALLEQGEIFISPAVLLEIKYLQEINKISVSPDTVLNSLAREIGLKICEEDFFSVVQEAMGYTWTRDPFDRIITATAAKARAWLVTKDAGIRGHYKRAFWDD